MKIKLQAILALVLAIACTAPTWAQSTDSNDPAVLVAIIKSPDASIHDKSVACKKLAFYGNADAIPALVALLPDEKLSHYARYGLEGIPNPAAAAALRESTKTLTGRQLVGVVGSLGSIRDEQAVGLLSELLKNEDPQVAIAAASSLGKIGNEAALEALKAGDLDDIEVDAIGRRALADACIECSERLASSGNSDKADEALKLVIRIYPNRETAPDAIKAAIIRALILRNSISGPMGLENALLDTDPLVVETGLHTAREIKTEAAAEVMVSIYDECSPEMKIQLVRFYGEMGEDYPLLDKRVELLLSAVATDDSPELQVAAVKSLASLGDVVPENSPAIGSLLKLIASEDEALQAAVIDTLARQTSKSIDTKLIEKFESTDLPVAEQCATIELIGRRRVAGVTPRLAALAASSDPAIRLAAVRALGETIALADIDQLLDLYGKFQSVDRSAGVYKEAVQAACIRMPDLDATVTKLAGSIAGKPSEVQVFILDRIGELGGNAALKQLAELAVKGDAQLQDAATRILGGWMTADGAPVLLELARTHPEKNLRIRTLRGFIRIVRQLRLADKERLDYCKAALDVAQRPQEKQLAIETLTRIVSIDSMNVALGYLGDPELKQQAAETIVQLAEPISENAPEQAVEALKKVVAAGADSEITKQARLLIARIEQRS